MAEKYCGIFITDNFIRLSRAVKNGGFLCKEQEIATASLKEEEILSRLKMSLKENKDISGNFTLGIPRNQVSVRYLKIPSVDIEEIKQITEYRLDKMLPYKAEELVFDVAVNQTTSDGYSQVMVVAVPKEFILKQLVLLKQAGVIPDAVGVSAVSLYNQFCQRYNDDLNYCLIDLEDNFVDILIANRNKLLFSRGIDITSTAKKDTIIKEVSLTCNIQKASGISIDKIILCGRGMDLEDMAQLFSQVFGHEVIIDKTLCVTNGLIMKQDTALQIDLLPEKEKMQKKTAKRQKVSLYLIALLLLNISLIANIVFFRMREKEEYLFFLNSEIKKLETLVSPLQKKLLKTQVMKNYSDSGKLVLGVLTELYHIVPEGLYLTSLDIRGHSPQGNITLTGQASDSETVLKFASSLKNSGLFGKTDVSYITKNPSTAKQVVDFKMKSQY